MENSKEKLLDSQMKSSRRGFLARAARSFPLGKAAGTEQGSLLQLTYDQSHSFQKEPNDINKLMHSAKAIRFASS